MTTTTPKMSLVLPDVNLTPASTWATLLNAALTTIDGHNHASGSGNQITPAGLNINSDLTLQSNNLTNVRSLRVINQTSDFSSISDVSCFYSLNDVPYFRTSIGTPLRLTRNNWITVKGSSATGQAYRAANISSASTTLTLTSTAGTSSFSSNDVGKKVCIVGAGVNGADLYTTITTYTSATQVTVNDAASTTVTLGSAFWYPASQDDTANIQAAINQASVNGGTVYLPAGVYIISSGLTASTMLKGFIGDGRTQTWIITSNASAKYDMLSFSGLSRGVFIKDLAFKHAGFSTTDATALSTAYSVTSNIVTITASNSFTAGDKIKCIGYLSGLTAVNDLFTTVSTASGSDFTFSYTTGNTSGSVVAAFNLDYNCIAFPDGNLRNPTFENLLLMNAPGDGIKVQGIVTGAFKQVITENCRGNGVGLYRSTSDAAAGTSTHFDNCYFNGSYLAGFYARVLNYSTLTSCAADSCGVGYYLYGGASVTLNSTGCEVPGYRNAAFPGYHYYIHGTNSLVMNGCYGSVNTTTANAASTFLVFDNTSRDCVVNVFKFNGGGAYLPTYAFDIKSGCNSIHIIEPNFVNFNTSTGWTNAGTNCKVFFDGKYATELSTTKRLTSGFSTINYSATPTLDLSTGNSFQMTLSGNVSSWTVTNLDSAVGQELTFLFIQDATGGRTIGTIGADQPYLNMYPNQYTLMKAFCDGNNIRFYSNQLPTPSQVTVPVGDTVNAPSGTTTSFATTHVFPPNAFQNARPIRILLGFTITTSGSPPALGIRVLLGGTTIFNGTSNVPTASMADRPFTLEILGIATAVPGASVQTFFSATTSPGTDTANSPIVPYDATPVALATNGSLTLQPQLFAAAATAGNYLQLRFMSIEYLK